MKRILQIAMIPFFVVSVSAQNSADVNASFQEARRSFEAGQYSAAVESFRRITQNFPTRPEAAVALYYSGLSEERMGNRDRALSIYRDFLGKYGSSQLSGPVRNRVRELENLPQKGTPGVPESGGSGGKTGGLTPILDKLIRPEPSSSDQSAEEPTPPGKKSRTQPTKIIKKGSADWPAAASLVKPTTPPIFPKNAEVVVPPTPVVDPNAPRVVKWQSAPTPAPVETRREDPMGFVFYEEIPPPAPAPPVVVSPPKKEPLRIVEILPTIPVERGKTVELPSFPVSKPGKTAVEKEIFPTVKAVAAAPPEKAGKKPEKPVPSSRVPEPPSPVENKLMARIEELSAKVEELSKEKTIDLPEPVKEKKEENLPSLPPPSMKNVPAPGAALAISPASSWLDKVQDISEPPVVVQPGLSVDAVRIHVPRKPVSVFRSSARLPEPASTAVAPAVQSSDIPAPPEPVITAVPVITAEPVEDPLPIANLAPTKVPAPGDALARGEWRSEEPEEKPMEEERPSAVALVRGLFPISVPSTPPSVLESSLFRYEAAPTVPVEEPIEEEVEVPAEEPIEEEVEVPVEEPIEEEVEVPVEEPKVEEAPPADFTMVKVEAPAPPPTELIPSAPVLEEPIIVAAPVPPVAKVEETPVEPMAPPPVEKEVPSIEISLPGEKEIWMPSEISIPARVPEGTAAPRRSETDSAGELSEGMPLPSENAPTLRPDAIPTTPTLVIEAPVPISLEMTGWAGELSARADAAEEMAAVEPTLISGGEASTPDRSPAPRPEYSLSLSDISGDIRGEAVTIESPLPEPALTTDVPVLRVPRGAEIPAVAPTPARNPEMDNRILQAIRFRKMGMAGKAITEYKAVLEADPKNPVALNNLADIYISRGENLDEAVRLVTEALSSDLADRGPFLATLGRAYHALGDNQRAEDFMTQAIQMKQTAERLFQRGVIYQAMGLSAKARADFDRARVYSEDAGMTEQIKAKLQELGAASSF